MIKKGLSVFLASCLALMLLPVSVLAEGTGSESSLRFVIENGVLTKYTLYDFNSEWSSFRPLDVTEEQKSCVEIPNGVTAIGEKVFFECSEIQEIRIPSSVTRIGDTAFAKCSRLKKVIIPDTVTDIGKSVFLSCPALTDVTIPRGLTSIPYSMFNNCASLEDITIPDNITSIEQYAFHGCKKLASITIPSSVTSIGNEAFEDCIKLASLSLPASLTKIGSGAFSKCASLSEITIPNSVTDLGSGAFSNCSGLTSITIPSGVTVPGSSVFSGCTGLKKVIFPENFRHITIGMFQGCTGLSQMTIPETVVSISRNAFANCTGLTSITIPDSVTSIGENVFFNCTGLTSVSVPASLNQSPIMGYGLFNRCTGLTSATLEDGMTYSGISTFEGCTGLTNVTIPGSLKIINNNCFADCANLKNIYYAGTKEQWESIEFGRNNDYLKNAVIYYNSGGDIPEDPDAPTGNSKILTLSPDSGAEFPGTVFDITFDREIVERTSNQNSPEVDLTIAAPFQIYRASDDSVVYNPGAFAWPQFTYGPSRSVLRISPNYSSANGGQLVSGEEYYITMGAGFVKFTDGATNPEIKKGDWSFKAKIPEPVKPPDPVQEEVEITFGTNYGVRTSKVSVTWDDNWFSHPASTYIHKLATTSVALSGSTYVEDNGAETALVQLGFGKPQSYTYESPVLENLLHNGTVGHTFAVKEIEVNGKSYNLVAVVLRGTQGAVEWWSNISDNGWIDWRTGFEDAAKKVMGNLNDYLEEHQIDTSSVKFLVTGHSRGGVVANLVAADLTSNDVLRRSPGVFGENVFCYTVASPFISLTDQNLTAYDNIYNIVNPRDIVTKVPPTIIPRRHGIDLFLPVKSNFKPYKDDEGHKVTYQDYRARMEGAFFSHTKEAYFDSSPLCMHSIASYLSWMTSYSAEGLFGDVSKRTAPKFKQLTVACPVDVYVRDEEGTLMVSVVNEAIVKDDLAVSVKDGVKMIDLPLDQDYDVRIEAREAGTVQYTVSEMAIQGAGDTATRTVTFNEIAIEKDDTLTGKINAVTATPVSNYTLTKTTESNVTTTIPAASDTLPSDSPVSGLLRDDAAVELAGGVPGNIAWVYAASYEDGHMTRIVSGELAGSRITFDRGAARGDQLFLLDSEYRPLCAKITIE